MATTDQPPAPEPPAALSTGPLEPVTTLVAGTTFCVCAGNGDLDTDTAEGLFVRDTRVLSTWRLTVDGHPVQALTALPAEPYEATYVGRVAGHGGGEPTLVVERRRFVGDGMREDVTVRNYGTEDAGAQLSLEVDADFADLFEVKEGVSQARVDVHHRVDDATLTYWTAGGDTGTRRGVRVRWTGALAGHHTLTQWVVVPAQGAWTMPVEVVASVDEEELEPPFPADRPVEVARPSQRMRTWRASAPRFQVGHPGLHRALGRTELDLGALRIADLEHPEDDVVAAGAPWFMALFGRDSLLTAWMAAPFAPGLALGTLRTLARFQGRTEDPLTEEQPGKILHEVRLGADLSLTLGGDSVYYGSIDATPLFVMLVDRVLRWGAPRTEVAALLPAVDRALAWIEEYGDRDGDGFVEYRHRTDRGLVNQGWKDSHDSIRWADGRLATGPIALAEVQGYVYAAYRARAHLAGVLHTGGDPARWLARADRLRVAFGDAFWLPDRRGFALALDGHKRPVDAVASNQGHCLWTGIVTEDRARDVAQVLLDPGLFTGFGVRTLDARMRAYNPVSYHNGSVWPHDSTLAAAGLARFGHRDLLDRLVGGLADAAGLFNGRLPELFCGFDRADKPWPVPYPTSCSPQAWAAAAPYELVRAALSLDACLPHGTVHAGPALPVLGPVRIEGLPLGEARVLVEADADGVRFEGLPSDVVARTDGSRPSCA